jgi:Flp pilus assembly protein TadG
MIARRGGSGAKATDGNTMVEFSLIVFLLMMLFLGVVEMTRMILVYNALANSARAGARYASVHGHGRSGGAGINGESGPGNNPAEVLAVVENYSTAGLVTLSASNITVSYSPSNTAGSVVTVTVSYVYSPLVSWFQNLLSARLGSTTKEVIIF